jgi:hypothetical protein
LGVGVVSFAPDPSGRATVLVGMPQPHSNASPSTIELAMAEAHTLSSRTRRRKAATGLWSSATPAHVVGVAVSGKEAPRWPREQLGDAVRQFIQIEWFSKERRYTEHFLFFGEITLRRHHNDRNRSTAGAISLIVLKQKSNRP